MKGLLTKDFYVLLRETKVFLLIVIVFAIARNGFTQGIAIMYASMLPITALSYDEQSKWDYLAEMMPYRRSDLVLSKYVTGYFAILVIGVIQTVSALVYNMTGMDSTSSLQEQLVLVLLYACCALLLMAVNLPILFKLGAEKGRMVYLIITIVCALAVVSSIEFDLAIWNLRPTVYVIAGVCAAVIAQVASVRLSIKFYTARRV
ncbi:ABC-2 transporter permease [Ihubacter sp. rT4E-8]|uniref:ABC-2 transporter permease n=1 Tax=unclassified Ihubacter TaxID=2633299 RepID=UPI003C7C52EA